MNFVEKCELGIGDLLHGSGMIDDFLRQAATDCTQDGLVAGMLLARQASLEGQHVFKSYEDWFQVTRILC